MKRLVKCSTGMSKSFFDKLVFILKFILKLYVSHDDDDDDDDDSGEGYDHGENG